MKHNLESTLSELCKFLNKFLTEQQMQQLIRHLQFENMKVNPGINPPYLKDFVQRNRPGSDYMFVRRGDTDSYKDEMPQDYIRKFTERTEKTFHSLGLYQSNYSNTSL